MGMMTAEACAREIVAATASRRRLLVTPGWYYAVYLLRVFFPALMDRFVAKIA
jgi:hypothetical protein